MVSSEPVGGHQCLLISSSFRFDIGRVLVCRSGVGTKTRSFLSAFFVAQSSSFDFLPLHVEAQVTRSSNKELVKVGTKVVGGLVLDSVKAVDVKLSLEGSVFCLVEILRHNDISEFLWFVDLKHLAGWKPGNDFFLFRCSRVF